MHYAVPLSETLVRNVVERVGTHWANQSAITQQERLGGPQESVSEFLVVQVDGSILSTKESGWKEAEVAVMYREEHYTIGTVIMGIAFSSFVLMYCGYIEK